MKFVVACDGSYYAGTFKDKRDNERPRYVQDAQDALIFVAKIEAGKVVVTPPLPTESAFYEMVAVSIALH